MGGFDTHNDARELVNLKFDTINTALKNFVTEMKTLGIWEDVAIVTVSDFGRKLTSNGRGTDHAWGGIRAPCCMHMPMHTKALRLSVNGIVVDAAIRMSLCLTLKETTSCLAEECAEAKCLASSRAACTPSITPKMSTTAD